MGKMKIKEKLLKIISVTLVCVISFVMCVQNVEGKIYRMESDVNTEEFMKKESYIVLTKSEEEAQNIEAKENNCELIEKKMLAMQLTDKEVKNIKKNNCVTEVEKNVDVSASLEVPLDKKNIDRFIDEKKVMEMNQWNLEAIGVTKLNIATEGAINKKNKDVKVAIMDSGINYNEGINVKERVDLVSENNISPMYEDATGHGTGIAGMINGDLSKGELQGVDPSISLYSVRVLDENNKAPISRIIKGIYWCIENKMDVVNLSFGCNVDSEALSIAVKDAINAGLILVAAAGNEGERVSEMEYPAAYDGVISVGASDENNEISRFTSGRNKVDILAPGEKVWTYSILGGYMAVDGTSISTAQVTGAIAILLKNKPEVSSDEIKKMLKISSRPEKQSQVVGVLNVERLLEVAEKGINNQIWEKGIKKEKEANYNLDEIVSGCWGKAQHKNFVNAYCSGNEAKLIGAGAYDADNKYADYKMLHAQHNYVRNLHFLYKCARHMKKSSDRLNTEAELRKFMENIDTTNNNDREFGENDIKKLREILVNYLKNTELNNKEKAAKILGLATHLLGDTFAHRTMVPQNAQLSKSDFNSADWSALKWRIEKFVIETRDLKYYGAETSKYEDNPSFYSVRFSASKQCVGNLIKLYNDGEAFSSKKIYVSGVSFNLKLNNLSSYAISNIVQNDSLDAISTKDYRVNAKHTDMYGNSYANETDYVYYINYKC